MAVPGLFAPARGRGCVGLAGVPDWLFPPRLSVHAFCSVPERHLQTHIPPGTATASPEGSWEWPHRCRGLGPSIQIQPPGARPHLALTAVWSRGSRGLSLGFCCKRGIQTSCAPSAPTEAEEGASFSGQEGGGAGRLAWEQTQPTTCKDEACARSPHWSRRQRGNEGASCSICFCPATYISRRGTTKGVYVYVEASSNTDNAEEQKQTAKEIRAEGKSKLGLAEAKSCRSLPVAGGDL